MERRLEVATLKQSELQKDLAGKLAELKSVRGMAAQADEANDLRSRLKSVLEQKGLLERDVEDGNRSCRDMSERAERAEATMREQSHELQRARAAAARAEKQGNAEANAELMRLQQELREAIAESALTLQIRKQREHPLGSKADEAVCRICEHLQPTAVLGCRSMP